MQVSEVWRGELSVLACHDLARTSVADGSCRCGRVVSRPPINVAGWRSFLSITTRIHFLYTKPEGLTVSSSSTSFIALTRVQDHFMQANAELLLIGQQCRHFRLSRCAASRSSLYMGDWTPKDCSPDIESSLWQGPSRSSQDSKGRRIRPFLFPRPPLQGLP